jgi:hypothetical protein
MIAVPWRHTETLNVNQQIFARMMSCLIDINFDYRRSDEVVHGNEARIDERFPTLKALVRRARNRIERGRHDRDPR